MKGWVSNSLEIKNVNQSDQCLKVFEGTSEEKVLEIIWNNSEDTFTFLIKLNFSRFMPASILQQIPLKLTTKIFLSKITRIYDPVHVTVAVLIKAKTGLQHLRQKGFDLDQELPEEIYQEWVKLFRQIQYLNEVKFKISLTPSDILTRLQEYTTLLVLLQLF